MTVNVNFPESAVQKATDDYVRELYRAKEKGKPSATPETKASFDFSLIGTAHAVEATIKVDSEKAIQIRNRMASRVDEVITQKRAGALGETNEGHLTLKKGDLKPLLKKKLDGAIADENRDRDELYKEVVRINGIGDARLKDIQKSFARSFQAESPSGTWVQDADGNWSQKP